jgi:ribosomal protein S10
VQMSGESFQRVCFRTISRVYHKQCPVHRRARLLTQQTSITVFRLLAKENNFRFYFKFAAHKRKLPFSIHSVYMENKTTYICTHIYIHIHMHINLHIHIYMYILSFQMENGSQAFFLHPFTVCSSYKWKFVLCPFADEEKTEVICLQTN